MVSDFFPWIFNRLDQSRSSYFAIGLYLLDVIIVYHIFSEIAIAKIYEVDKNILFISRKIVGFIFSLLQFRMECDIIKR